MMGIQHMVSASLIKRISGRFNLLLLLLVLSQDLLAGAPPLVFSKSFDPNTIGPGSTSTLTFTIDNTAWNIPATDLAFTDTLPTGMTIATPDKDWTDCANASLSAPDGGSTITLTGGGVGAGATCSVKVNVTSSAPGAHTNTSGNLTSSAGNSGPATADLTVDTGLPGFRKSFSPSSVSLGERSTLTFTIDNTANSSAVSNLDFTDTLPTGMVIAAPANSGTTCGTATIPATVTAQPGSDTITLDSNGTGTFPAIAAGASCTVTVDVVATGVGEFDNLTGDLLADFTAAGKATAALTSTVTPLTITKSFTDDPVIPGNPVNLEFTLYNFDRNNPATDIAFSDNLSAVLPGITVGTLPVNVCGASSTLSETSGVLNLTGGSLPASGSCTFSIPVNIPSTVFDGSYLNTTSQVTGTIGSLPVTGNAASDLLFVSSGPVLTKEFLDVTDLTPDPVVGAGDDVVIRFTIANQNSAGPPLQKAAGLLAVVPTSGNLTEISFTDELTSFLPFPVTVSLPPVPDPPCGIGSALALVSVGTYRQALSLTGGNLTAGSNCSFEVTLSLPSGLASGNYLNTTSEIIGKVGSDVIPVIGKPASDTLAVVAAPRLTKSFTNDPVLPGDTVTLEFTLTHAATAPGAASNIAFTDNLSTALSGLSATGTPVYNLCGAGNGTLTGTTSLNISSVTLNPGEICTFSVSLDVPTSATYGTYTNTTSDITATILGASATGNPASDDLKISGLSFTKTFVENPVIPGQTATLRFTIDNLSATDVATGITFTDNLSAALSGLTATTPLPATPCGTGSNIAGTTLLVFSGGNLNQGTSCSFDIPVIIPASAADGDYQNVTSSLDATMGGAVTTQDPAVAALRVDSTRIELNKSFTNDPVQPGDTVNLRFTLTNLDSTQAVTSIAFTDDLSTTLSGLSATGLPVSVCGGTLSGTYNLSFSGGSLAAGANCQFDVTLQVPASAPLGSVNTNTTSSVTGLIGLLSVNGSPASDDLSINAFTFTKAFNGPTTATGTPTLTFTIQNLSATNSVTGLSFTDNLDAVLTGLVATSLQANPCGTGSMLSGTGIISLTGGNLPPNGQCNFTVNLQVPANAGAGSYPNTTSDLLASGLIVAGPASATLTVEPPPVFSKTFTPTVILAGQTSQLNFTVDNSASAVAASSIGFSDNFPSGVTVANPANASTTCSGGTLTATPNSSVISYSGGSVGAGSSCQVSVEVTGVTAGTKINTTGTLISSSGSSGTATATLTVNNPTLTVTGTGSGSVTATGISCTINSGTTSGDCTEPEVPGTIFNLTAAAGGGSQILSWTGCDAITGTGNELCQLTLNTDQTVTVHFGADDNDGIAPTTENQVPDQDGTGTGDGNGDGTPDAQQPNVSSLQSSVGNQWITIANETSGYQQNNIQTQQTPTNLPFGVDLPMGLLSFDMVGTPIGATVEMSIYVPASLGVTGYYKQTTSGQWVDIATSVTTSGVKTKITFKLTDGDQYDGDLSANGTISDPGAPGRITSIAGARSIPTLSWWALAILTLFTTLIFTRERFRQTDAKRM